MEPPTLYKLTVRNGPDRNKRFVFEQSRVEIGSDPTCDLLLDDPSVGERHAVVAVAEGRATLEVTDPARPVRRGEETVDGETRLESGDVLSFGELEVQFHALDPLPFFDTRRTPWITTAAVAAVVAVVLVELLLPGLLWWLQARGPEYVVAAGEPAMEELVSAEALNDQLAQARDRLKSLEADQTGLSEEERWDGKQSASLTREIQKMRERVEQLGTEVQIMNPESAEGLDPAREARIQAERAARDRRRREGLAREKLTTARRAIADNRFEDADALLVEVQLLVPSEMGSYMTRARLMERQGNVDKAIVQWEEVLKRVVAGTPMYEEANAERSRLIRGIRQEELARARQQAATVRAEVQPAKPPPIQPPVAPPVEVARQEVAPRKVEPAPVRRGNRVKITDVRREKFQDRDNYEEIRLVRIGLMPRKSGGAILGDDVEVRVHFFDRDDDSGSIALSRVPAPKKGLRLGAEWKGGEERTLSALYMVPDGFRGDEWKRHREHRSYYGYVVQVMFEGALQDERAFPSSLLDVSRELL